MATKKGKISLQDALRRDLVGQREVELDSDLEALFKTLKGDKLLEALSYECNVTPWRPPVRP